MPSLASAAAPAPLILKPTSAWQVDYADERCRLARQFGEGKQAVFLIMDRFAPTDSLRLTISGQLVRTFLTKGDAYIQFGPNEQQQQLAFLKGNIGEDPGLVFTSSARIAPPSATEALEMKNAEDDEEVVLRPISEDRQKAVRHLRVGKPLRKPVMLETGSMRAPLAALNTCIDNLLISWGVDVENIGR